MTEKIGDYVFNINNSSFTLNYLRNRKDKFDCFISGIRCLAFIGFTSFMIYVSFFTGNISWSCLLIAVIFLLASILFIFDFITYIFEPIKNIVIYNHHTKKISIRDGMFKTTIINRSELNKLEYQLHTELIEYDNNQHQNNYWLELYIITKKQEKFKILDINKNRILKTRDDLIRKTILMRAKPLINKFSELLEIESRYNRNIENYK